MLCFMGGSGVRFRGFGPSPRGRFSVIMGN